MFLLKNKVESIYMACNFAKQGAGRIRDFVACI